VLFPELTTPRLHLSPVLPEDQAFLFEGLGDPVAMPYNGVYYKTLEDTAEQLKWYQKNWNEGTGVAWKITSLKTTEPMGVISIYHLKPEHRKAELGYWLLPRFWRQGVASEALAAIIPYVKNERGLHRLEAFVEDGNTASERLLKRAGFVPEGTMRECELKFGRFISLHIYALLFHS
jgi:ribosomal-protein-alanine N-acetyltransferase